MLRLYELHLCDDVYALGVRMLSMLIHYTMGVVHMYTWTHVHMYTKCIKFCVRRNSWSDSDSLVPCIERMGCTWHYLGIPGQKKHLDTMSTEHLEPMINFQNNCYPKEQLNAF